MLYLKYLKHDIVTERQAPIPINKTKISFTDIIIERSSNNCYKKNQFTFKLDGLFFEHEKESSVKKGVKCITLSEKDLYHSGLSHITAEILYRIEAIYVAVGDNYIQHPAFTYPEYFELKFTKASFEHIHTKICTNVKDLANEIHKLQKIGCITEVKTVSTFHNSVDAENVESFNKYYEWEESKE